jgi:hypothetical protein
MFLLQDLKFSMNLITALYKKVKQSYYRPRQAPRFPGGWGSKFSGHSAQEDSKFVSPTQRPPLPPGNIPGTHFYWRLSQPQDHSAAGRIMSMKNSNDTIRNRTRDLPACSAVPQSTAPPRAQQRYINTFNFINSENIFLIDDKLILYPSCSIPSS